MRLELSNKRLHFAAFAVLLFTLLIHNNSTSLWDQDEAAYASFGVNMVEGGDWLIPEAEWADIHRKPPLHFWNIALSMKIFGINEFAIRLSSTILIFGTYLLLYFGLGDIFSRKQSFIASIVLATSLLVPALGKIAVTDGTILFFSTLCSVAMIKVLYSHHWKWIFVFWISFMLGTLTKGPTIILFTATFWLLLFVLHPNRKQLIKLHPWFYGPIALTPIFLWGYTAYLQEGGPEFVGWMIDWYILKRIGGSVLGQTGPPGYHLAMMGVFFMPYLMYILPSYFFLIRNTFKEKGPLLIIGAWFIASWLYYEITPSKLPTYVIVAHVPLALFITHLITQQWSEKRIPIPFIILHFVGLTALYGYALMNGVLNPEKADWPIVLSVIGGIMLAYTIFQLFILKHPFFQLSIVGGAFLFQFLVWPFAMPDVDDAKNGTYEVAEHLSTHTVPSTKIIVGNDHATPPSLLYYLNRNFDNVELSKNQTQLRNQFQSETPTALVLSSMQFDSLQLSTEPVIISKSAFEPNEKAKYYLAINPYARID